MSLFFPKRRISSNGVAFSDVGQGATIVLLHGVGLCGDVWLPQQISLSSRYRVISPDLPGHGGSTDLDDVSAPTLDQYCDLLEPALLGSGAGPVVLIGHSLGALLSARLYARGQLPVRAICLISSVYGRSMDAMRSVIRRAEEVRLRSASDLATAPLERWFGSNPDPAGRVHAHQCRQWLEHAVKRGYAPAYRVFAEQSGPSAGLLNTLVVPALFLTGQNDPNSTPAMSDRMAAVAPFGKSCVMEGAAHMLTMTHAAEVSSVLSEFIAG